LSAVRECLFDIFTTTLHIAGRTPIRNLRTQHALWQVPTYRGWILFIGLK